jgi:transposase
MEITTACTDLANSVFQVLTVDQHGKVVLRKQLKRGQMAEFFANRPACTI